MANHEAQEARKATKQKKLSFESTLLRAASAVTFIATEGGVRLTALDSIGQADYIIKTQNGLSQAAYTSLRAGEAGLSTILYSMAAFFDEPVRGYMALGVAAVMQQGALDLAGGVIQEHPLVGLYESPHAPPQQPA